MYPTRYLALRVTLAGRPGKIKLYGNSGAGGIIDYLTFIDGNNIIVWKRLGR